MFVTQTYETTIVDAASGISAHMMVIPARSLPPQLPDDETTLFNQLGLQFIARLRPFGLNMYVLSVLSPNPIHWPEKGSEKPPVVKVPKDVSAPQIEFAEFLTSARVVPFEESPLNSGINW